MSSSTPRDRAAATSSATAPTCIPSSVSAGKLRIRGYLHARPGLDPVGVIHRGRPMVPLTDASIEYVHHAMLERRKVGTVLVNRERIDVIDRAADHEVEVPELVLSNP